MMTDMREGQRIVSMDSAAYRAVEGMLGSYGFAALFSFLILLCMFLFINVKVTLTDPADLPDNAELSVTPVELSQEAEDHVAGNSPHHPLLPQSSHRSPLTCSAGDSCWLPLHP